MDEINKIVHEASTELYQKAAQEKKPGSGESKGDDFVDADYEVKDDKK